MQLNADKSEVIFLSTTVQLLSAANITTVNIAGITEPVVLQLVSLSMTIDSKMQYDCQMKKSRKSATSILLPYITLTNDVALTVSCSIVVAKLNYCNALVHGALAATFDKLQQAQSNLARVACQCNSATTPHHFINRFIGFSPIKGGAGGKHCTYAMMQ